MRVSSNGRASRRDLIAWVFLLANPPQVQMATQMELLPWGLLSVSHSFFDECTLEMKTFQSESPTGQPVTLPEPPTAKNSLGLFIQCVLFTDYITPSHFNLPGVKTLATSRVSRSAHLHATSTFSWTVVLPISGWARRTASPRMAVTAAIISSLDLNHLHPSLIPVISSRSRTALVRFPGTSSPTM